MQKRELYGIKLVHPVDCMMPNFADTLPHKTGEPIHFMNRRAEVHHYAQVCSTGKKSMVVTQTHFGHNMRDHAVMPAVAIIYKVACPEDVYQQLQSENWQSVPMKFGSLEGMEIHPIEAYVQEDPLHGACRYSLYEIGAEIAARWNDYRELNIALENSTPEQLRLLDFKNLNIEGSLRLMYGEAGRINTNFFTVHSSEDHLMSIEKVMYKGRTGIGYAMHLLELENKYQDTYNHLTNKGYSRDYAAAHAAKEMATTLQKLSGLFNDQQADKETFSKLVDAYQQESSACAQDYIEEQKDQFIEQFENELDLFE